MEFGLYQGRMFLQYRQIDNNGASCNNRENNPTANIYVLVLVINPPVMWPLVKILSALVIPLLWLRLATRW